MLCAAAVGVASGSRSECKGENRETIVCKECAENDGFHVRNRLLLCFIDAVRVGLLRGA